MLETSIYRKAENLLSDIDRLTLEANKAGLSTQHLATAASKIVEFLNETWEHNISKA